MNESVAPTEARYRGVYRTSWGNRWFGQLRHHGKLIYLGTFADPQEASLAVESERTRLHGGVADSPMNDSGPNDSSS